MKKRETLLLTFALVGGAALGAVGIFAATNAGNTIKAGAANAYDCASVHWGMDDATFKGNVNLSGTSISVGNHAKADLKATLDGIDITGATVATQAVYSDGNGLKFSSSKKNSTLTITFDKEIVGCDIYAAGWASNGIAMTVNGKSTAIAKNDKITGTSVVKDVVYDKYAFDFDETANTLTIAATGRFVIGDIALRVVKE